MRGKNIGWNYNWYQTNVGLGRKVKSVFGNPWIIIFWEKRDNFWPFLLCPPKAKNAPKWDGNLARKTER